MKHSRDEGQEQALCSCEEASPPQGQILVGLHERVEVIQVDGRDVVRRCETHPCPDHVAAILRARAYNERFLGVPQVEP